MCTSASLLTTSPGFLHKNKGQDVDSVRLYSQTVVVSLGLSVQRVRADKGTEYTSSAFQTFCIDCGIALKFAVTATPNKLECRKGTDGRPLPSQGAYLRTATPLHPVGRNVIRSSFHLQ